MALNIGDRTIPQSTLVDASSAGNTGIQTATDNSGVQRAQPSSSLAQAHGTEAKQVSANQKSDIIALSVEVKKLREEAKSIENPKGFGKFINACRNVASKLFGFVQSPTDRLNYLQNEIKILEDKMDALLNKMMASESSGPKDVQPTQVRADMGVQSSSDDLRTARELATTSAQHIEDIHDEVKTQLTETSRPQQAFEPFMDRNLVEIMFGPQPDLPTQASEVPGGVGGLPPPPPGGVPPPPPGVPPPPPGGPGVLPSPPGSAGAPKAGGTVDQKAVFASDVALFQKVQTEGHQVSFSRQIQCADGKSVSVNVAASIHSKAEEADYKRQLQAKAGELGTMIKDLRAGLENLQQQTLDVIATMEKGVASGARGIKTITLDSGLKAEARIKLSCDYSKNPLQFFNDIGQLRTDGLITDSEYDRLQSIKNELTAKQTEYTNALTNAKALETVKQELETASGKTYLPKGSPMFDTISSILFQRSQLPAELQSYWNNFSYESMDASLKRAQDLHQQKIDQKLAQLEQKKAELGEAKAQYSQARVAFLDALERSSLSEAEKSRLRNTFDSDDGFTPPTGSVEETNLLGNNVNAISNKEVFQVYKRLTKFNPNGIKTNIEKLTDEITTLQKSGPSAGLRGALIGKQVQISLEPNLLKVAQQIRGGAQFDFDGLSKAIEIIKKDKSGGISSAFIGAQPQLEAFASQLGYNAKNADGNVDANNIKGLMNLVKHLQTHNSPEDIHALAENIAQSKTFTQMPNAGGMNNAFFTYVQKMA
ncbi:MAG: hypothetical protein LBD69_00970 [Puniceicoccales bacterium]|jgi:hypothetical protein|nr:hypothetical protein [Puniceicoccales bacterium]